MDGVLSGIILFLASVIAFVWANTPLGYENFWNSEWFQISPRHFINEGFMTIFFLVVGFDIKRELIEGELSSRKKAFLPVAGALGGMIFPALIYLCFNFDLQTSKGWGIPTATDIAFAVAILSLYASRIPKGLRVFLTALAIVDDLGAVIVIAIFYTAKLSPFFLTSAFICLLLLFVLNKLKNQNLILYFLMGALLWWFLLKSGIHSTIAGVLLAVALPLELSKGVIEKIHPYVAFGIVPLFGLANAGVTLNLEENFHPISTGIFAGLFFGKQIGITLFSWIVVKLKWAELPAETQWKKIYVVSILGGIGFTMSLFVTNLAFTNPEFINFSKVGILAGSIASGVIASLLIPIVFKKIETQF